MNIQLTNMFQEDIMFISWCSCIHLSSLETTVMSRYITTLGGRCISPVLSQKNLVRRMTGYRLVGQHFFLHCQNFCLAPFNFFRLPCRQMLHYLLQALFRFLVHHAAITFEIPHLTTNLSRGVGYVKL